jgi:1,4-dihydroxy-2-naphthoate octaprenyltransferase
MIAVAQQWIKRHEVMIAKAILAIAALIGMIALAIHGALLIAIGSVAFIGGVFLVVWSLVTLRASP